MENISNEFFCFELKQNYLEEFKLCGIPVPLYSNNPKFTLKFKNTEAYLNYRSVLKVILTDLELADPENCKYEIQRSKAFIINVLQILRNQFTEKYN